MNDKKARQQVNDYLALHNVSANQLVLLSGYTGLHEWLKGNCSITLHNWDKVCKAMKTSD